MYILILYICIEYYPAAPALLYPTPPTQTSHGGGGTGTKRPGG